MTATSEDCGVVASARTVFVLDAAGRLLASFGEGAESWRERLEPVRALAERALARGRRVEMLLAGAGGEWRAAAEPGRWSGSGPVALVALERARTDLWTRDASLDSERLDSLRRLIAGMVHELRNPLASISLTAEILALRSDLPDAVRERLSDVVHHVERADEVLLSLRRFSREERGTREPCSLNQMAEDAVRLERHLAEACGASIELDLDPTLPSVLGEPSQLRLVVANLVRNAAEAIEGAGRRGKVSIRTSHRHGVVRLAVEDDGPGIPVAVLPRVFEPRFTTKDLGSGVGLPMSLGIVKAHGGHLWAENRRRAGARFVIDLPDPQHSTPAQRETALGIELGGGQARAVLVVDGDAARLDRVRTAVAAMGAKVHVASEPLVALRKLRAADFDAVLVGDEEATDATIDLCARLRLVYPQLAGRIVLLVERLPGQERAARLRDQGIRAALVDPGDSESVQALVRSVAELPGPAPRA